MADLNFPTSPTLNQTYSFGGKTWVWNGAAWQLQSSGAINNIPIGNVTPSTGAFTTLSTTGNITSSGNISGSYFLGNGRFLSGISASGGGANVYFQNTAPATPNSGDVWIVGNTAVQLIYFSDGTSNQWAEMEAFETYSGSNVTNMPGGSIYQIQYNSGTGSFAGSTNLTFDGTTLTVTGTVNTSGTISSTGNITGSNISATGNVVGGNLTTSGAISVGSVIGNLISSANAVNDLGSTSQRWRDLWLSNSTIYLGNAQISANATAMTIANPAGGVVVLQGASPSVISSVISATGNVIGGNVSTSGLITATGNITGGNINSTGVVSAVGSMIGSSVSTAGNVTGGNINTAGLVSATGTVTGSSVSTAGNITGGNINTTGTVTGGALLTNGSVIGDAYVGNSLTVGLGTVTLGNIVNSNANGVGNIGSAAGYFNTIFATAAQALYADLAEYYEADKDYEPGTVLEFGGEREVTMASADTTAVAGVVSTNPAYSMNAACPGQAVPIALQGRTPCLVHGPVRKGDLMVSAGNGWAKSCKTPAIGQVIGKALENFAGEHGTIEIAVGRL